MSEPFKGILAMLAACAIWGLSALFYKLIAHVPPLEVLSHRTVWGCVVVLGVLAVQGRLRDLAALLSDARARLLVFIAAVMISINWFTFILSVQIGHLVESSLGYYIFPLVAVLLGVLFLGERLRRLQMIAVALATIAVVQLTFGLGIAPWISLVLAFTFGFYGLIKKPLAAGPVLSVGGELVLLLPLALVWLCGVHFWDWQGIVGRDGGYFAADWNGVLLVLAGPMTAVPLILMAYAMKRLTLSTVGLVQYLNPTLQFTLGVVIFAEAITQWHVIAFVLIWAGLALYSFDGMRRERAKAYRP